MSNTALEVHAITSVKAIDAATWDGLIAGASPFLKHAFLAALETSGCVGEASGWIPFHIVAYEAARPGIPVGLAPAFLKAHSMGEFVYDWAWADAAQRLGISYYPKLIVAAPFSPVSGRRLYTAPGLGAADAQSIKQALITGAVAHAREVGCSGVHVLFCTQREVDLATSVGFAHRLGCQYHWTNEGYRDFEDFLGRFDSKRRNQIRRERRRVKEQGIVIRSYRGREVQDSMVGPAYEFYGATVDRYVWGRRYLNRQFFDLLWRDMRDDLQLTLAHVDDGSSATGARGQTPEPGPLVGGSINLQATLEAGSGDIATTGDVQVGGDPVGLRRFGRYWGTTADLDSLHFEVCSYGAIEDCIRTGVKVFEAGAGGEQHKLVRGFLPTPTHSVHLLFEPRFHAAVDDFCRREATHVRDQIERLREGVFAR